MSATRRLTVVVGLNLALVVALVLVGLTAHSLGILAAALDYVADAAAIAVSLVAIRLSRRPDLPGRPNRYRRATGWAAGANGAWLLGLSALVVIGAIDRLMGTPPAVHGLPVLVMSGIAAFTMFAGAAVLRADADGQGVDDDDVEPGRELAMRAVLLDTVADAAIALGVALTGAIILVTNGLFWLDPAVAIGVSLVVAFHAVQLLRDVAAHLAPKGSGSKGARPRRL